jgi:hypothetical protein
MTEFQDESFDTILDKALLDAVICADDGDCMAKRLTSGMRRIGELALALGWTNGMHVLLYLRAKEYTRVIKPGGTVLIFSLHWTISPQLLNFPEKDFDIGR